MDEKYKKEDFKTPGRYFEGFTDKLLDKIAQEDLNLPEKEGFAVPTGYFEKLDKEIVNKLSEEKQPKVIQLRSYKKYYYAVASVAAVLLLIFVIPWNSNRALTFDDLAKTEIEAYFENTDLELSSYELAEALPVEDLQVEDFLENTVDEENIMDYLDENLDNFDELDGDFDELNLESDE